MTPARALIEEAITATLAARGITAPLGRPVPELLFRKVAAPAAPRPAADEQLAALQGKVNAMTLQEVGAVTRFASQYFGARHATDRDDPVTQLVYYGVEAFLDTAAEIARLHSRNLSSSAQKRLLEANLPRLDAVVERYRTRLEDRVLGVVNGELGLGIERLEGEYRAALAEATEQATRGLDQAQAEATEQRRLLDAASAQLTREREAHAAELARLTGVLERERRATVERDRAARNELHQLRQDLANQRGTVAHLNAECQRLEAALAEAARPAPAAPEALPMSQHGVALISTSQTTTATCGDALAATSLCAHLRGEGVACQVSGRAVSAPGPSAFIPAHVAAWAERYPTAAAQLAQLRTVVRPLAGRAA